jgi:hypothetical protein
MNTHKTTFPTLHNKQFEIVINDLSNDKIEVIVKSSLYDFLGGETIYTYNGTAKNFFSTQSYLIAVAVIESHMLHRVNNKDQKLIAQFSTEMVTSFFQNAATIVTGNKSKSSRTALKPSSTTKTRSSSKRRYGGTRKVTTEIFNSIVDDYESQGKTPNEIARDRHLVPETVSRALNKAGYKQINKARNRQWNDARLKARAANIVVPRVSSSANTRPTQTVAEAVRSLPAPS